MSQSGGEKDAFKEVIWNILEKARICVGAYGVARYGVTCCGVLHELAVMLAEGDRDRELSGAEKGLQPRISHRDSFFKIFAFNNICTGNVL